MTTIDTTNAADPTYTTTQVVRIRNGTRTSVADKLAMEEPLEIRLGYTDARRGRIHKSIAITMRTPGDDIALALGFLFAESIITSAGEVTSIDAGTDNVLRIELREDIKVDSLRLERHFYTTSSCGVCGKASLETLSLTGFPVLLNNSFSIHASALMRMSDMLYSHQVLFNLTGGNHATAVFNQHGEIELVKEDIGRHNAMDKLTGTLLQQGRIPMNNCGILISGRASFEMLQKALAASCPMLLAVGAPSSLAVELAQEFNITLVGFLGDAGFNIYHGADRILS
jgi:FdhD protein